MIEILKKFKVYNFHNRAAYNQDYIRELEKVEKLSWAFDSRSKADFKRDFIREHNLKQKLIAHGFEINKLWCKEPPTPYDKIKNESYIVKNMKS